MAKKESTFKASTALKSTSFVRTLDLTEPLAAEQNQITPLNQLAAYISNGLDKLTYEGVWNASNNTPQLVNGEGIKNGFYLVTKGGNTLLDSNDYWAPGDWALFDGQVWRRVGAVGLPGPALDLGGVTENYTLTAPIPAFITMDVAQSNLNLIFPTLNTTPPLLSPGQTCTVFNPGEFPFQVIVKNALSAIVNPQELLIGVVNDEAGIDWFKPPATGVTSFNNETGAVEATTDLIPEGSVNFYATNARIDARINAQKGQPNGICPLNGQTSVDPGDLPDLFFNAPLSGGYTAQQVNLNSNPLYFTTTNGQLTFSVSFLTSRVLTVNNIAPIANNVTINAASVGLGNVNNTSDANKPLSVATQVALNNKADLVNGVIPTAQIPAIAISEFLGVVANQAAMLALNGQKGDFANRSDTSTTWIITGDNPTQLASWTQLNYPSASVTSVNGAVGAVVLGKNDIGLGNVDNTSDVNKPISTATQAALGNKVNTSTIVIAGQGLDGGGSLQNNVSLSVKADSAYFTFIDNDTDRLSFAPTHLPLQALTTTQVNALQATLGSIAFNGTLNMHVYYNGSAWVPLQSYAVTAGYNNIPSNGTADLVFNDPNNSAPFCVPRAGLLFMMSMTTSQSLTSGLIILNVVKNSVAQTSSNSNLTMSNPANPVANSRILPTAIPVAQNDRIILRITTSSTVTPANMDMTATFWISDF